MTDSFVPVAARVRRPVPDRRPPPEPAPGAHAPGPGQPRRRARRRGDRLAAGRDRPAGRGRRRRPDGRALRAARRPLRAAARPRVALRCPRDARPPPHTRRRRPDPRRPRPRPARRARRAPRRARSAAARSPRSASGSTPTSRSSTATAGTCSRASSTRTCTCACPGRSTRRTSRPARARRPPAASSPSWRCRTRARSSTRAPILRSLRESARREARDPGRLPGERHPRPGRRGADRDGRAARVRRARLHRRRQARPPRRHPAQGAAVPEAVRRDHRAARGGPDALRAAASCTRARSRARLGLAGIPSISESTLIARDAAIARYEDGRIHIQHLSARESVEAVAEAKARGVRITCEASPHHLTLTDEALLERLDTRLKMNPPLRSEDDRQALIAGLKDGTIDCIATDHAPHAREEKEVPFEEAPMGTTGLETAFAAVYTADVLPLRADRREAERRRRADGPADAGDRGRQARRPGADRPRRGVGGRRGRLREPRGELLLRRAARCAARSSRRSPPAGSSTASGC